MASRYLSDLKQTWDNWLAHDGPRLAASLSPPAYCRSPPLVLLTSAIAALAFGRTAAQNAVINEVQSLMGADGARTIQSVIEYAKAPRAGAPLPRSAS